MTVTKPASGIRKSPPTLEPTHIWQVGGFQSLSREQEGCMNSTGFAHGFLTLSEAAEFLYKTTDYWASVIGCKRFSMAVRRC